MSTYELRAILEIRAAGLAAERREPAGMKALKGALARMRGAQKWEQGGVDAGLDFHRAVAQATGNPYLLKVASYISEQTRESIAKRVRAQARWPRSFRSPLMNTWTQNFFR